MIEIKIPDDNALAEAKKRFCEALAVCQLMTPRTPNSSTIPISALYKYAQDQAAGEPEDADIEKALAANEDMRGAYDSMLARIQKATAKN